MAIQFKCPYCTAAIKVPDTSTGKRGTCPKCKTKLVVPDVEIPTTKTPTVSPTVPPAEPDAKKPTASNETAQVVDPAALNDEISIPVIQPISKHHTKRGSTRGHKKKGRRKNSTLVFLIPLAAVALLVAVLLIVFYQPERKLEGVLTAQTLDTELAPGRIQQADVDTTNEEFTRAVESLKQDPFVLTSELLRVEFTGADGAIEIRVTAKSNTKFVAVSITDPYLRQYIDDNAMLFERRRMATLRISATDFVKQVAKEGDRYISNAVDFRNTVGLNSLRGNFGFVIDGAVGTILCPCVFEFTNQVWFAVPETATTLVIRGRTIDGMGQLFHGRYTADIRPAPEKVSVDEPMDDELPGEADDGSSVNEAAMDEPTEK